MACFEDGEVGFEEGISWLPSHVLEEAIWDVKDYDKQHEVQYHQYYKVPRMSPEPYQLRSKSSPRPHLRTKNHFNSATGGPGMQAVFLDSGKKSCGTGVFLPRKPGNSVQCSKRPACCPVLVPVRVVQALQLNVNEIGLQISRRQATKTNSKGGDCFSFKNKKGNDVSAHRPVTPQNENSSPDVFLPKEWTY
ncbi:hypothetical protein Tsubulata_039772 [Turnera subulata]|uniref:Uncharacterized protein n=1 Tax=Turnera subulata TaxID=218843 RepID=A0A9Q0JIQ8_9ROSI|nr:hypothetical protein Tsubulata_039772 [Turnera subulata]